MHLLNASLIPALERILLTVWVGSLWVTGFVVAPVLFAELADRTLAGSTAGTLLNVALHKRMNWRALTIAAMLLLIVIGQFVITPMVAELRLQGLTESARFGRLHGVASVLFLLTSVLGLLLVAAGQYRQD